MATEERIEQAEDVTELVPTGPRDLAAVGGSKPVAPQGITEEESQEIQSRATDLVKQLEGASGSRELEIIDSMTSLGIQSQRNAGSEMELLRSRVGEMITNEGPGAEIAKDLLEVRVALNQINPNELAKRNLRSWAWGFVPSPFKSNPAIKILQRIAIRYEPVSKQVTMIEAKLRDGRAMLVRDNVEMRKLYERVEAQQLPIQRNVYMGELVMQQLTELLERTGDAQKAERVRSSLHDVSTQVQDLRSMETVHIHFFVSLEMSRQNNTRLGQSVERTLTLATNVVTVGLAIQTALARQKRVLEATQRTREFLGNVLVANAAAIKQHTNEIGDVYNNPVIAIDKISQAHNDLIDAMDTADRLKQEGIDAARENIAKLRQLSSELQQRASGLWEAPVTADQSVED